MNPEIIVALITLSGSAIGAFAGIAVNSKLTNYRIEQLEKKVDRHNGIAERASRLEEEMKETERRLSELEKKGDFI